MKIFNYALSMLTLASVACSAPSSLSEAEFKTPPASAKPRTWMHAMSGNMSKEGMTKDLEAIHDAGIGGIMLFNIAQGIPYGDVLYNSDEHHEMLKHAAMECERLGLSFGYHNCDGWTSSGGPWITPEESMKQLTYSEAVVKGGAVDMTLPMPSTREGFYEDIAVLAYPAMASDIANAEAKPRIKASDKNFDIALATDKVVGEPTALGKRGKGKQYVTFEYAKPFPLNSIYLSCNRGGNTMDLFVSDNGRDYTFVKSIDQIRVGKHEWTFQESFEPVTARYFKLEVSSGIEVLEMTLSATCFTTDYLAKNSLGRLDGPKIKPAVEVSDDLIIKSREMINLTSSLKDGRLVATLPEGEWNVMRFGYTSTGAFNHPASDSGRGLESDKFSAEVTRKHFDAFAQRVLDNVRDVAPNAMQYVEIDSYEMGGQNWTKGFEKVFAERMGYDIIPHLPSLVGRYVDSAEIGDAVADDFRDVCAKLMELNYYKVFGDLCRENGVISYVEPYGFGPFNYLDVTQHSEIPMGEFWMNKSVNGVRRAVSGAHVYGKNIVSAESFTANYDINWAGHPEMARPTGDESWKAGINEFFFHRYAHQANVHVRPGMTMNRWGFHFDGTQTWWMNAGKAWFEYMARGSYMLRQGVPVADVLFFVGDVTPTSAAGSAYICGLKSDAVNADVLINRVSVKDGKMTLPEGAEYQMLVLQGNDRMKMETLRRLCELAEAGVPMTGKLPAREFGYAALTSDHSEFDSLIERIKASGSYYEDDEELVEARQIERDLFFDDWKGGFMGFEHRAMADGTQIYFLSNVEDEAREIVCDFRVAGKTPELWNAMDGSVVDAANYEMYDGRTKVTIDLDAKESVFVVFRENTSVSSKSTSLGREDVAELSLNEDWSVQFEKEYGFDGMVRFGALQDWALSDNEEVKYYSGSATYSKSVEVSEAWLQGANEAILDLGTVEIAAEVKINGEDVVTLWCAPYTTDIYPYLKAGDNTIEIRVTNQWTNRLIGDERYPTQSDGYEDIPKGSVLGNMPDWYKQNKPMPAGPRMTFCTHQFYTVDSPLIPAGLIGPAAIEFVKVETK